MTLYATDNCGRYRHGFCHLVVFSMSGRQAQRQIVTKQAGNYAIRELATACERHPGFTELL